MSPYPKRSALAQWQSDQLHRLVAALLPENAFYSEKWDEAGVPRKVAAAHQFSRNFPFTTRQELLEDQRAHPPYGSNLTYPVGRFTRCHETRGTRGMPLRWLDTPDSWEWMLRNWEQVLRTAGIDAKDRIYWASSFGPALGFWGAFEAAARLGCLCLPGGSAGGAAQLRAILDHQATVLCCTPTRALRLADIAASERIALDAQPVKLILTSGEPGACIAATRARIERAWPGARVTDHYGMTEAGPATFECPARPGVLHVMENAYYPEVIDPTTGATVEPGGIGELVLTPLDRPGSPVMRYRTGDLVRPATEEPCECGRHDLALEGGILGRVDDMTTVHGVQLTSSAIEEVVYGFDTIAEYRLHVGQSGAADDIRLRIEPTRDCADPSAVARQLEETMQTALRVRIPVTPVPPGSLPRFETHARRRTTEPAL
ncbi:MAG: AMP-binding protein [Verrucomicrobia bacterium]|nr:AMP-binding protein [Verrucomicrobiota bacterium]